MDRAGKDSVINNRLINTSNTLDRAGLHSGEQGSAGAVPSGDAVVINVAPEIATSISRDNPDNAYRTGHGLKKASGELSGGALHMASQPFQYAANMGLNLGGFVLGEFGYSMPGYRPENNPSQISCCSGTASRSKQHQATPLLSIPEADRTLQSTAEPVKREPSEELTALNHQETELEAATAPPKSSEPETGPQSRPSTTSISDSETSTGLSDDKKPSDSLSRSSGDLSQNQCQHYDPENDVILRLEAMTAAEVRALNLALWVCLGGAAGVLVWQFCGKLITDQEPKINIKYIIANAAIGSVLFVALNIALINHISAVRANWHKSWTPRRTNATILITIDLVAQWIMLLCFIIPNFIPLRTTKCVVLNDSIITWFMFGRWTMWNTLFLVSLITAHNSNISSVYQRSTHRRAGHGRTNLTAANDKSPVVVADLPFWMVHWWKILLWICMECSIIATVAYVIQHSKENLQREKDWRSAGCGVAKGFSCNIGQGSLITSSIMVAFSLVYFILYCEFLRRSLPQLRRHSNVEFKFANTIVRIQLRLRLPTFSFFALSLVLLWYVKPYNCTSVITTWMGLLPGQIGSTVTAICLSWVASPKKCMGKGRTPLLQVWLQEFAWTKAEKEERIAKRNASMAQQDQPKIANEPMFCVEEMLKCLYMSLFVYDFPENESSRFNMEDACSLFRPPLVAYEMFWEKSLDTKCLMAWSRTEIILVFRGTASLTNVVADVQAWRTFHLPRRGTFWRRPKIHSGFDRAWRNNGLNERVINKLKELFVTNQIDRDNYRFYITGHSMGAALAQIAAFEIRRLGKEHGRDKKITCITFGGPRTGNHAFAAEFNEMVPDSWNIINDQDLVARTKFFWLYKRGGHRVIINKLGDLIVRPSPLEASLRVLPLQGSVNHHLLTSYLDSIVSVFVSQFSKQQRESGTMARIVEIVRHDKPLKALILDEVGLDLKDLVQMSRWGGYAPLVAHYHAKTTLGRRHSSCYRKARDQAALDADRMGESCGCCDGMSFWIEELACKAKCSRHQQSNTVPNTKDGRRTVKAPHTVESPLSKE